MDADDLLLSAQNSLLGEVIPELRAVTLRYNPENQLLVVNFFYDCTVTEAIHEMSSCIITEIISHFSADELSEVEENILELRFPKAIPIQGSCVYLRRESHFVHT